MAMMPDMSVLQFIVNFHGHDAGLVRIAVHQFFPIAMMPAVSVLQYIFIHDAVVSVLQYISFHDAGRVRIAEHRELLWP